MMPQREKNLVAADQSPEAIKAETREGVEKAYLTIGDGTYEFPIIVGSEGERGIDISKLREETGVITLDPGFGNTGACRSKITFVDGERGILRYRGYPIEQLAKKSTFIETAMLLISGDLPTLAEREDFRSMLTENELLHEGLRPHFEAFPPHGKPMTFLSAILNTMRSYEPKFLEKESDTDFMILAAKIMSKIRTIAAWTYNKSIGVPLVDPNPDFGYCKNFLHMMFSKPNEPRSPEDVEINALEKILILHADHEQNCSTSTTRIVGSSQSNLFASVSSGVSALYGKSHGGANSAVIEQLEEILKSGDNLEKFITRAKDKSDPFRLMGFGHRVYKNFDPRAKILKESADDVLGKLGIDDPLLEIAKNLEKTALADDYFREKKLYPNVDFYSGIILKALKIPTNMFPVIFAIGRMPGWIAHWREQYLDESTKIARPRQIYTGHTKRDFIPMEDR